MKRLTDSQKAEICADTTSSNYALAEKFGVSRRLIQFIKNPERLRENRDRRRERTERTKLNQQLEKGKDNV